MDFRLATAASSDTFSTPLLAVPVLAGDDGDATVSATPGVSVPEAMLADLRSGAGSQVVGYAGDGVAARRLVLIGVGKTAAEVDAESLRRFAAHAVRAAESLRVSEIALVLPSAGIEVEDAAQAVAEGAVLAAWRFRELKTGVGEDEAPAAVDTTTLLVPSEAEGRARAGMERGVIMAEAENLARDFQSRPGNVATPTALGESAGALASQWGLEVDVLGPDRLREERMGAILAVAQGSAQEPRLIVLRHNGGAPDEAPLVLVGKGLTFDAGGISIKPALKMEDMKFDMSGGAAVLGAMTAVARLNVPKNVIGIVPSSENLVGAAAMKPGDVITTRAGITVEVINTDAEGRLILCDALDYAVEMKPEAMVDCATLTGAVVIGLGHQAMAVLGTDPGVVSDLRAAGDTTGERCWELPLWPEYRKQLESPTADVKNVGGRPAGTITAATFLREFVKDVPWGHLDVAGTAYGDGNGLPYRRAGGYGVPTRLLVEWVRRRSA